MSAPPFWKQSRGGWRSSFLPVQEFVQEVEGALAVDLVGAVEEFDLAVGGRELQLALIEAADLGKLVADPLLTGYTVAVPAFDHERPRGDRGAQLRVAAGA